MLSNVKDYLVDLGLAVSHDKIKSSIQEKQVRARLEDFIQRQGKYNYLCTTEEEIDFETLTDYLQSDLIADVRVRLCGTSAERSAAHGDIMSKVRAFARAKTKVGEKRAMDMVTKAMEILRSYYRSKINADLLFIACEVTDQITENVDIQHTTQTQSLVAEMERQREEGVAAITDMLQFSPERVVAEGIRMTKSGDVESLEKIATDFANGISTQHKLFPNYGFDFRLHNGQQRLTSIPLAADAEKKYPPKFKCVGTVRVGDKYVGEVTPGLIDYANRHQLPLQLNITQAQKLLGTEIDPVQYEAEELVGKVLTVPPKPFRKAFPCSISINDVVEFDYVLFWTQEILDDGTTVVSNREQADCPFMFTMKANLNTKCLTFTISLNNADNADTLKYVQFMKAVENGGIISVKSLELQEEFARGQLDDFQYTTDFDDIDEEVHFWEMVVAVEKHFDVIVDVPNEILDSQYRMLQYLYSLIIGDTNTVTWSTLALRMDLTEKLKSDIAEWGDTKFALAYVGSVEVPLWGQKYELPIVRRYLCVKPKDLDRLKKKADVLDVGEEICLNFVPGDGEQGAWEDTLHHGDEESISDANQLVP